MKLNGTVRDFFTLKQEADVTEHERKAENMKISKNTQQKGMNFLAKSLNVRLEEKGIRDFGTERMTREQRKDKLLTKNFFLAPFSSAWPSREEEKAKEKFLKITRLQSARGVISIWI